MSGSKREKKPTDQSAGNSEALRIYEAMEQERLRKFQAKAEAAKPKKVTLPRLKFLEKSSRQRRAVGQIR